MEIDINFEEQVEAAYDRIHKHVRPTPLEFSHFLSELLNCNVYLKLESLQHTGSFKIRGALNKVASLGAAADDIITASTGNHALGVAYALSVHDRKGTVYVPENASPSKLKALSYYDIEVRKFGSEGGHAEKRAREVAEEEGKIYVSPYNDRDIIAGQGTIGLEIWRQNPSIDAIFICVGGGGLIAGVGGYLKAKRADIQIVGCMPENSPVMYESIRAGHVVELDSHETLSDGSAGNMDLDSITFNLCQRIIDDQILVSEEQIKRNIIMMMDKHRLIIEGSAAVPIASLINKKSNFEGKNIVIVLCGANIDFEKLRKIILEA